VTALQVFDFGGRPVRTAGTFERPLFCGVDVCGILGLATSGKDTALARLDADERVLTKKSAQSERRAAGARVRHRERALRADPELRET
jgi:prophage antirepressor-like protein